MALIIEDGTGRSDAESYVSVADCDTYHVARGNDAWSGDEAAKEAALREATAFIEDRYRGLWRGQRRLKVQRLQWPRHGVVDQDGFTIDHDIVPIEVKDALCEAALRATQGDLTPDLDRGGQIKRQKVDVIETEYRDSAPVGRTYPEIEGKIMCLLDNPFVLEMVRG
ncbi:MAG: DnaT-like ssDNA-binding protein [Spirochaetota bacterium]